MTVPNWPSVAMRVAEEVISPDHGSVPRGDAPEGSRAVVVAASCIDGERRNVAVPMGWGSYCEPDDVLIEWATDELRRTLAARSGVKGGKR